MIGSRSSFTQVFPLCSVVTVRVMARGSGRACSEEGGASGCLLRGGAPWLARGIVVDSLGIPFLLLGLWCCLQDFNLCLLKLNDEGVFLSSNLLINLFECSLPVVSCVSTQKDGY